MQGRARFVPAAAERLRCQDDLAAAADPGAVILPAEGPDPCRATWAISSGSAAAFDQGPAATAVGPDFPAVRRDQAATAVSSQVAPAAAIAPAAGLIRIAPAEASAPVALAAVETTVDPDGPAVVETTVDLDGPAVVETTVDPDDRGATADGRAAQGMATAGLVVPATARAPRGLVKAAAERNGRTDDRRGMIGLAAGPAGSIGRFTLARDG